MATEIRLSDMAQLLYTLDKEIEECEADLRALKRQKSDIERREHGINKRIDKLREVALKAMSNPHVFDWGK
jgi:predicted  nucleic acid-binding Zn-ribbon protein